MSHTFVAVASQQELAAGKMLRVEVAGKRYLIARVDDEYFAVDDNCSHEDSSLYLGCLQGDMIRCSLHGSRFSLRTGQPQEEPADEAIGTYALKLQDGQIWMDPTRRSN
ncbi:MAG: non-heme iron oxygenase ferredoxin subunit [gamma proteobacterium symbiont of Bathyaustriella thionipta]|nr:non-heme iron oxygenase ferredoxin subunit [gamma proteobacterium symbiont of Bathyaustriella thionipta]